MDQSGRDDLDVQTGERDDRFPYLMPLQRRVGGEGRRDQAIRAAIDAIIARGYEHARFSDVARISGIAVSTLQYYFGSREAMLLEALVVAANDDIAGLVDQDAPVSESPWERLERLLDYALCLDQSHERQWSIMLEFARVGLRDPEVRAAAREYDRLWRLPFAEAIRRGTNEGVFQPREDPDFIASRIVASADGISFGALLARDEDLQHRHRLALLDDIRWWLGLSEAE